MAYRAHLMAFIKLVENSLMKDLVVVDVPALSPAASDLVELMKV